MEFAIDGKALWISVFGALLFFLFHRLLKDYPKPRFLFPDLQGLRAVATSWRVRWAPLSRWLLYVALVAFVAAYLDPHLLVPREKAEPLLPATEAVEGIAIYLVLDQSGSMADPVTIYNADGGRERIVKIDLLKRMTTAFVKGDKAQGLGGRPNDLLGMVALARGATVLAPLTLDHQAILDNIKQLQVLSRPEEGGTAIGYAIFKTANLIAATRHYAEELIEKQQPAYSIKSNVIIVVTDGLQDPNPLDEKKPLRMIEVPEAAEYARQTGVKLYIINIDPALASEDYAAARNQMRRAAELTGGKYFLAQGTTGLADIYADIDKLEKSALPTLVEQKALPKEDQPHLYRTLYLFPYLVSIGLLVLFLSLLLDAILLRRAP